MSPRVGAVLAATVLLGVAAVAAPAASPATTAQLRQAETQLRQLDRQSETPAPASAAELRSTVARWRAAAAGYGRLGAVAAIGERSTPPGARRVRAAWAALRDLAGWRARQLSYSADLFSETLRDGTATDGAKEGIARMTLVEGDLRARLRAALARIAT